MKILSLKLTNFKGIRSFQISPEGADVSILGDNGTGKTTVFDAFTWLFSGKNSLGAADFEIKTLDENGNTIPGLDHEVEGIFDLDVFGSVIPPGLEHLKGKRITLRRVYHEVWTKQRGSATKQFSGHSTDYFTDGVPVKKNEYEAQIHNIIMPSMASDAEQTFRLLTDPRYFNEVLPWEKRREILINVSGDVSDDDIIASDKSLATLPNILNGHSLDDAKKVSAARKKAINQELTSIPERIDEVSRGLPEPGGNLTPLSELKKLREQRNRKSQELANLEAGGGIAEATKRLREVENELVQIQKNCWLRNAEEVQAAKIELRKLQDKAEDVHFTIAKTGRKASEHIVEVKTLEENLNRFREDWHKTNAMAFAHEDTLTCPACKQALPAERIAQARETALALFNRSKAAELELINKLGKGTKEKLETLRSENVTLEQTITNQEKQLGEIEAKVANTRSKINELEALSESYQKDLAYLEHQQRKQVIENEIAELKISNTSAVETIKEEIQSIDAQISECEKTIAQINQRERGLARIEELKNNERCLAKEFEGLESQLYLIEQFVRTRVNLLEDKINAKFSVVKFKLFSELVNGAIEDTCLTLIDGVSYPDLNHGGKMAAGLDIISILQSYYGFKSVVWIDNAESFCHLPQMDCQVIKLIISEADKTLRIQAT